MSRRRQIALLIETSNAYARGLLEGVSAYIREHRNWSVYLSEHGRGDVVPAWLKGWKGDGIIARIENAEVARAVRRRDVPTVDLSAARQLPRLPWVETDNAAIARLAVDHLLERGFRNFGFYGLTDYNWSVWRCESFVKFVAEAGSRCAVHMTRWRGDRAAHWVAEQRQLVKWLAKLPKPAGVLACFDTCGRHVLEACRSAGIRVPDDVAVIGVDNDPLLCELSDPPLSSVAPDTRQTGYMAARLLDRMMGGSPVAAKGYFVAPLRVVTRQSTDVTAIEDKDISDAVRLIRERACEGITVADVLRAVPLSRRVFETRFARFMGRTPHQQIVRTQLDRAKDLLVGTDLPLKAVAQRVGVAHPEYLNTLFRRMEGVTPGGYRRRSTSGRAGEAAKGKAQD